MDGSTPWTHPEAPRPGLGDHSVRSRSIPSRQAGHPALEFIEATPEGPAQGAPVLFLHGGFAGAWSWSEIFLPFFARSGRHAAAVSFRGHGGSDGYKGLRRTSLADYLTDARRAIAELPEPPILVAHSLGGLVAQKLIGCERIRALVLMCSLPPEGMALVGPRLAMTEPLLWAEAILGSVSKSKRPITAFSEQILFSEGLPRERVARYAAMMTPESPQALTDAHVPGPVVPAFMVGLRTLVLGGSLDRLIWRPSTLRTALYHGGTHESVEGAGHFMQLDLGAEGVACRILDWLDRIGA